MSMEPSPMIEAQDNQQEERRLRDQRTLLEEQRREARPAIHIELPEADEYPLEDFAETPCFNIHNIHLSGELTDQFQWIQERAEQYTGQCLGQQGLARLLHEINQQLLSLGYVTSQVALPEQDLSSGTLQLMFFPGRLQQVILPDGYTASWRTAFPLRPGDVLNIRAMEQGLEQMKRLASQDIQMEILPADRTGYSDIQLKITRTRPLRLSLTLDDSGGENTGKYQGAAQLAWDNPLRLQDQLVFGLNQAIKNDRDNATRSNNVYYGLPYGYWLLEASYDQFDYHQQVTGTTQSFMSRGKGHNKKADITRTLLRNNVAKLDLYSGLTFRKRNNFINDTEIVVQRRRLTHMQLGFRYRHYMSGGTFNANIEARQGIDLFQPEKRQTEPDSPDPRYLIWQANLGLTQNFNLSQQPMFFSSQWRGQWSDMPIYSLDWFSVGGRYSVRGYEGVHSLSGSRGWLTRNELGININKLQQNLFVALDAGGVDGMGTEYLDQSWLSGIALGLRGQIWQLQYDAFIAHPLWKPESFKRANSTGGFALTWTI